MARDVIPQLLHTETTTVNSVATVRQLEARDVDGVVDRIVTRLRDDAALQPLVNQTLETGPLGESLLQATGQTWVAERDGELCGHLFGARLESESYGNGVWIGPDGASFDDTDALSELYSTAGARWIEHGALEHYVWTLDDVTSRQPWYEMGFARMHLRGVLALHERPVSALSDRYTIRRGGVRDIDLAVALDDELDAVQKSGPSFSIGLDHSTKRDELLDTLAEPDVHHYVVDFNGVGVAQCITFPLPPRRGSFNDTLHLSAVTVSAEHRGRGIGTAMVDVALNDALDGGFKFAETNWRVTNRQAQRYWLRYGFAPTYVRLHRTIGAS